MSDYILLKSKYPDKTPIIVNTNLPLKKKKFLVENNMTIGEFIYFMRKQIKVKPDTGLFLFINNKIPVVSHKIIQYDQGNIIIANLETEKVFG
jgi:hypothetical protein